MRWRWIWLSGLLVVLLPYGAGAKAPGDFKLVYRSSAGHLAQATQERVEVLRGNVSVSGNVQDNRSYRIDEAQLEALYQIVLSSGFMTWKKAPEVSHQSGVEEVFEVTANGSTVSHGRWEDGNQDAFREFFAKYNAWLNGIRTVRF
ncbi:MAG TPA: hypothetical protein DF383_02160 [Deltaproteobacteria bacterium]|nr:hypothetical protein [Deltaproteobacteria bacterium]